MIESKHMIIIGVIACALMAYYFYSELSKMKKLVEPVYHKSLSMELRLSELEKKTTNITKRKINVHSPPLSITYNSSDIGRNQMSVIYDENIRESEANRLLKNIENKNKRQQTLTQNMHTCPVNEYDELLVGLSSSDKQSLRKQMGNEFKSTSNSGYDSDIMRYVSESLYYADLPSEGSQLSDIPKPLKQSRLGSNVMSKITLKHKNELKK
jgi:hypothetical protein